MDAAGASLIACGTHFGLPATTAGDCMGQASSACAANPYGMPQFMGGQPVSNMSYYMPQEPHQQPHQQQHFAMQQAPPPVQQQFAVPAPPMQQQHQQFAMQAPPLMQAPPMQMQQQQQQQQHYHHQHQHHHHYHPQQQGYCSAAPVPQIGTPQLDSAPHAPASAGAACAQGVSGGAHYADSGADDLASEDLNDMFDGLDDWIHRVPSPPPAPAAAGAAPAAHGSGPLGFPVATAGSGNMAAGAPPPPPAAAQHQHPHPHHQRPAILFDFSQFQQPLPPRPAQAERAPQSVAPALEPEGVADLWGPNTTYEHRTDGNVMKLLFGAPDQPPEMATIHLHQFTDAHASSPQPPLSPFGWPGSFAGGSGDDAPSGDNMPEPQHGQRASTPQLLPVAGAGAAHQLLAPAQPTHRSIFPSIKVEGGGGIAGACGVAAGAVLGGCGNMAAGLGMVKAEPVRFCMDASEPGGK